MSKKTKTDEQVIEEIKVLAVDPEKCRRALTDLRTSETDLGKKCRDTIDNETFVRWVNTENSVVFVSRVNEILARLNG